MRRETRNAILVVAAITVVAGGLRFWNLDEPKRKVFDEVYYASDGCLYAGRPYDACGLDDDGERSWVHPPLGKWAIAGGVAIFGNNAFGWRAAPALAGTVTVALAGVLAFLLWGSVLWAGVASLLLSLEFLNFVQSRISMLDIFLALFVLLGFVLLVWDRRRHETTLGGLRPIRLLAGASFGAAIAVKWSGVLALLAGATLSLAWSALRLRSGLAETEEDRDRAVARRRAAGDAGGLALAFLVVPLVVYVATWIPWIVEESATPARFVEHHAAMADYHLTLETVKDDGEPIHPYMSEAWTWLPMLRPVAYYWEGGDDCAAEVDSAGCAEILGIGSPALFWGSLLVIPYLAVAWVVRRNGNAGTLLVPILVQYLPWLLVSRPLFLFYMAPITPFLALGATSALRDAARALLPHRALAVPIVAVFVLAALALFVFFWPVLTGQHVTYDAWHQRMWLERWV